LTVQGSTTAGRVRRRARARVGYLRLGIVLAALALLAIGIGYAFAGPAAELAPGTKIAGVDVGRMSTDEARALLARRAAKMSGVPVVFVAGSQRWSIRPRSLGVTANWRAAVEEARRRADGSGFLRGYRRIALRFSPIELTPTTKVYQAALDYELGVLADAIDRPARDAKLHKRGLRIEIAEGRTGTALDRETAPGVIVRALAALTRAPVELPVIADHPKITARALRDAAVLDRRILSAPVTVSLGGQRQHLTRWQLASMLRLQRDPDAPPVLGGPAADKYFGGLGREIGRPPRNAGFEVSGGSVRILPAQLGLALDVPRATATVLTAAERRTNRVARLALSEARPERTTAEAKAMGITGVVGSYETIYGGIANRIHNVQLVAHLIDGKLIGPGATFSFNRATGERSAAKGFLEAPVIINGELQTGLGGGVCQVSTTVFNAAYEAGLPIISRTNHALYISHYPLGRDATVDYPDVDLRFVNDTKHWLLLRTFVGSSSLVVSLYGAPQHRRVVSEAAPLHFVAPAPIVRSIDSSLAPGSRVIDSWGVPAQSTSVRRLVYGPSGKLLYDSTWYSRYQAEPRIVRLGPKKPKPEPKPKPKKPVAPAAAEAAGGAAAPPPITASGKPLP
jgi:vancomycin resistance protein YoaR